MEKGRCFSKKVWTFLIFSLIMLTGMLSYCETEVGADTKGYLLLVEEKDGSWSEYGNCIEVKAKDKLMVSAPEVAEKIGVQYKAKTANTFTISNGKKKNTYTTDALKYKYYNGSKTVSKTAAYKSYVSATSKTDMIEYRTLALLVSVKLFNGSEAGEYQKAGCLGVLCLSKYHKISKLPEMEAGTRVTTQKEFLKSAADLGISNIIIAADIILTEDVFCEREENPVTIHIRKGKSLTIDKYFLMVGGSMKNDGTILVKGCLERGICNLINQGVITIENGGSLKSGMSDLENKGSLTIAEGASLIVDRGSAFYNYGEVVNMGTINISDGGSVSDNGGKIINDGIIDLYTYYNGDISLISGSGTVNDYREAAQ